MNVVRKMLGMLSAVALAGILVQVAHAGQRCCARCGRQSCVVKVCRPVCTTIPVEITCWDCLREDFCVPHRPTCGGGHQGSCDSGGCDEQSGCGKPDCGACAAGRCAEVRTRNRLIRKTVVKQIPVVQWVVEYVCNDCCGRDGPVPEASPIAPPSPPLGPPPAPLPRPMPPQKPAEAAAADEVRQAGS